MRTKFDMDHESRTMFKCKKCHGLCLNDIDNLNSPLGPFSDASVIDSEAVSEYMQNQFRTPPRQATSDESGRAASQMSHDADEYLAPVSCSGTPTPIPLGPPPAFYPVGTSLTVEGAVGEEPLYHEIPGKQNCLFWG